MKSKTPSNLDTKAQSVKQNQALRAQKLRRLLTANSAEEKKLINAITSCIKYMHQNYDIEWQRLARVHAAILHEFKGKQEPTHVPEEMFARFAQIFFKI